MGHRYPLIDAQPFDLVEHRYMRHVRRVAAENLARCDDAYRHPAAFHRAYLNGRSLRTKGETLGRVKRILRFAGRMAFGNIQSVEIVIIRLDLAVVLDRVAHRHENVLDLLPQDRDRMQMPRPRPSARDRYIKPLSLSLCI